MKKIGLFVSTFRSAESSKRNIILPVSSGAALYDKNVERLPLCDDSGDNISAMNPSMCELTVQYWAWKNCECDICGLFHQRRYLDLSEICSAYDMAPKKHVLPYRIFDLPDDNTLSEISIDHDNVSQIMEQYSIIAPVRENIYNSVRNYYDRFDRVEFDDIGLLCDVISDMHPDQLKAARQYFTGKYSYFCNMFMANREIWDQYSQWLFGILMEYDKRKPDSMKYPRELGKIGERLFGVYMTYIREQTDIKWAEVRRAHFSKVNGFTPENASFNKKLYYLCPPGSLRRGLLRKLMK